MNSPFRVLCADPPWLFADKLPGAGRGAEKHYPCMSTYELCQIQLPPLANDCVLFLWRVAAMQQSALDVVAAWGFQPKTEIVWAKKTRYGKRWFGMGRIVRAEHEICIVATRKWTPNVLNHSTRSMIVTDLDMAGISAEAGRHSEKPEEFYTTIETLLPGPYCELFARRTRPGWTTLGSEVGTTL